MLVVFDTQSKPERRPHNPTVQDPADVNFLDGTESCLIDPP